MPWVFPVRIIESAGFAVPAAADTRRLSLAQRPPFVYAPDDPVAGVVGRSMDSVTLPGGVGSACREARRQSLQFMRSTPQAANIEAEALPRDLPVLLPEFDLSSGVHFRMGLFDLMRLREDSENEGLRRYSDKILFKTRLVREGIPVPKIFFMTNREVHEDDMIRFLKGLGTERFVAKPTHLAATSFVYAMHDGINLVNGLPTTLQEVVQGLIRSRHDSHLDDWATESTTPGIIIEELVPPSTNLRPAASTPDELKCHTFFGEFFFCEWLFVKNMTSGADGSEHFLNAHQHGDRALPSLGHSEFGIPNFVTRGFVFKDGSCFDCEEALPLSPDRWRRLVEIVEAVAAGTDHIRIDMFITPDGDVVVNEANISFLKISKLPPDLVEEMRRRWLEGYRALHA